MKKIVPENASLIPDQAERVFNGIIFDVYQWNQQMFDGTTETFEMLKRVDTLKVLAVTEGKIVVLEEEQPKFGKFMDIPGGRHDHHNESILQASQREMLEETGMSFENWRLIDVEQPFSKAEWFTYLYLAINLSHQDEPNLDAGERISINMMPFDEYRDLAKSHKLRWSPKLFDSLDTLQQLLNLPEYKGKEVDR